MFIAAKTLSIYYQKGNFEMTNGVKGGRRKGYRSGHYFDVHNGWGYDFQPSKLTVECEIPEIGVVETWVDFYFKNNWGRLTTQRIDALIETLPSMLELEDYYTASGSVYYKVSEACLKSWLDDAKMVA